MMRWYPLHWDPPYIVGQCDGPCGQADQPPLEPPGTEITPEELQEVTAIARLGGYEDSIAWLRHRHPGLLVRVGSMTSYHTESHITGTDQDPNHMFYACPDCEKEYTDHWQSMWDDYNAGRL
jgi:hypothetical protein